MELAATCHFNFNLSFGFLDRKSKLLHGLHALLVKRSDLHLVVGDCCAFALAPPDLQLKLLDDLDLLHEETCESFVFLTDLIDLLVAIAELVQIIGDSFQFPFCVGCQNRLLFKFSL